MTKQEIREICLEKLRSRSIARCAADSAKTRLNLIKTLKKLRFRDVLIYLPLWFEADLRPIFRILRKSKKIYAPRVDGDRFKMVAFRLPLERRKFGILSPAGNSREIKKVDLIIAPSLAIDADFKRIGFGKGMYDRFFCELIGKPKVIFIQPFFLAARERVTASFDMRGDYLVSAKGVICHSGKKNVIRNWNIRGGMRVFGVVCNAQGKFGAARRDSGAVKGKSQSD